MRSKLIVCPFILAGLAANSSVMEAYSDLDDAERAAQCRSWHCQLWWACQEPAMDLQGGLRSLADMLDEVIVEIFHSNKEV